MFGNISLKANYAFFHTKRLWWYIDEQFIMATHCLLYTKDFRNFVHFYIFNQPHVTFMILFMIRFIISPVVNCAAAIANLSSTCKYFRFFILFVQHLLLDKVLREQRCQKNSLLYSRSLIVSHILAGKQSQLREPVKKQGSFPP